MKGNKNIRRATMEEEEILVPIIILSLYAREFPALFRKWDQKQNGKTLLEAICTNHQRIGFFADFLKVNILANQYSTLLKVWNFPITMTLLEINYDYLPYWNHKTTTILTILYFCSILQRLEFVQIKIQSIDKTVLCSLFYNSCHSWALEYS